jgi:DNA-binding HxlR family transcriptional regulator
VSYALTPIGNEIAPLLANVMQWLGTRITHIADSQQEFDNGPAAKV